MPIKALVLDLDQTMVDTSSLEVHRKNRDWTAAKACVGGTATYPQIQDLLKKCDALGLKVGVVTTSPSAYAKNVLAHHGLKVLVLIGYHDVIGKQKPHPAPMQLCAEKLGVAPSDCLTVGDLPRDIQAGKAAGMLTAAALWGCADVPALLATKPNYTALTVDGLVDLIDELTTE